MRLVSAGFLALAVTLATTDPAYAQADAEGAAAVDEPAEGTADGDAEGEGADTEAGADEDRGEAAEGDAKGKRKRTAGYESKPTFGSADSPSRRVDIDDEPAEGVIALDAFDAAMERWYDLKQTIDEAAGIKFGFNYVALYQSATATNPGQPDNAASHGLRGNLTWTIWEDTGHTGFLNLSFEAPSALGNELPADSLGPTVGSSVLTSITYGDSDGYVANVYWQQGILDNEIQFALGRMDPGVFWSHHPLIAPATDFLNVNSGFSLAIPYPGIGFGAVAGARLGGHSYVAAGIHDANARNTLTGVETWSRGEFFYAAQAGLYPDYEERWQKQVHLTGWYSDRRDTDGVPESWGLQLTGWWTFQEIFLPFARIGHSVGGAAPLGTNAAVGLGIKTREKDQFAFAVGYAKPSDYSQNSSFHTEAYWRIHLLPHIALTPSAQLIIDPPNNADKEVIGVIGWRIRIDI
jgi:hypothetical protein